MKKMRPVAAVLLLVGSALLGAACSPYGTACSDMVDCLGGNDMDYDACIEEANTYEQLASLHKAEEEWEDYLSCVEKHSDCDGSGDNKTFASKCNDELAAFLEEID